MTQQHFEVQHHTIADGWVNCWTDIDVYDNETPSRYDTFKGAMDDLDDMFDEVEQDILMGFRDEDTRYNESEYRIVKFVSGIVTDIFPYKYVIRGSGGWVLLKNYALLGGIHITNL